MEKEYVLVESKKLAEIKYKALQKLAANKERPLSEASIEARAVLQVINTLYELDEISTQDPAICEYSGLRPVEGYQEEEEVIPSLSDEEIMKMNLEEWERMEEIEEETDEERAYRRGYMDGYNEGVYDGEYK